MAHAPDEFKCIRTQLYSLGGPEESTGRDQGQLSGTPANPGCGQALGWPSAGRRVRARGHGSRRLDRFAGIQKPHRPILSDGGSQEEPSHPGRKTLVLHHKGDPKYNLEDAEAAIKAKIDAAADVKFVHWGDQIRLIPIDRNSTPRFRALALL